MLINPQFVVLSSERLITGAQALTAVMLASVLQAVGRIVVPSISDKIGRKITLVTVFILSAATILGLVVAKGLLYPALFVALAFYMADFWERIRPCPQIILVPKMQGSTMRLSW